MKYLLISILIFILSCAPQTFFGARISGKYKEHFQGKLVCSKVDGWYKNIKCMCLLTEPDIRLKDKTLIAVEMEMCE